jgi:ribosomal protein S27AE
LKEWTVKLVRHGNKQLLGITCPHCGGKALVAKHWRVFHPDEEMLQLARQRGDRRGVVFRTRPCPYCFRASYLPGYHPDKKK